MTEEEEKEEDETKEVGRKEEVTPDKKLRPRPQVVARAPSAAPLSMPLSASFNFKNFFGDHFHEFCEYS